MRPALLLASIALTASGCYAAHPAEGAPAPLDGGARPDAIAVFRDAAPPDVRPAEGCASEVVGRWDRMGLACSAAVDACVRECAMGGEGDCVGECIGMEPDCQLCFYQTVIACGNELGCLDRWRGFACCTEDAPACRSLRGVQRLACAERCPGELDAWSACFEGTDPMRCFLEAAGTCGLSF